MSEPVVMVEEQSMQVFPDVLLPKLLPEDWNHLAVPHQG